MALGSSELILNADGSIYHLNLLPTDIATTIITVGDPDRVHDVSKHFDTITVKKTKREFHTHTGLLKGKRLTVISTGIGTDNVDIVLNELDALVNIDFKTKRKKTDFTQLELVRIGTSGAIQPDIEVDSFLGSEHALGLEGLLHFYEHDLAAHDSFIEAFLTQTGWDTKKARPYLIRCDENLQKRMASNRIRFGITATNSGFYGPQGRNLRLRSQDSGLNDKLARFEHKAMQVTNLEMETAGIYALAKLLGHRAISMNCILANRSTKTFSKKPQKCVNELIDYVLERLVE